MPAICIPEFYRILHVNCAKSNMAKVEVYNYRRRVMVFLFAVATLPVYITAQHTLTVKGIDKDSVFIHNTLGIQNTFKNQALCIDYVYKIPDLLRVKGYPHASIDSFNIDSLHSIVHLYIGEPFQGAILNTDSIDPDVLEGAGLSLKLSR